MDKNCSRLVQLSVQKHSSASIIDDILKDGSVDYQIPVNFIQNSRKDKLEGCTALHIAIQNLDVQAAQRLLQNKADFTIQNSIGESPLHQAFVKTAFLEPELEAPKGELIDTINAILEVHVQLNIVKNPCDRNGLSHFHAACIANHQAAVEFFISKGTSVNRPINSQSPYAPGCTPLHLAVKYSGVNVFKTLLSHGADITLRDARDLTPLHRLIDRNMVIAYSMETEPVVVDDNGKREFKENRDMIELVLEKYQYSKEALLYDTGLSYFHVLCTLQDPSKIEQFLSANSIDLHQSVQKYSPKWSGYTALHFAAHFSIETVKVLLKHGANIMAENCEDITPFSFCRRRYKVEDIYFIVEHQPDWKSIVLSDGKTLLLELLFAMRSENLLRIFVQEVDVNISVPINSPLWPGGTPLYLAIILAERDEDNRPSTLYVERIRILLNAGADVTTQDSLDSSCIQVAFYATKFNAVHLLLQSNQLILDHFHQNDVSHLHIACAAGNLNVVRNMFQGYVNVNLPLLFNTKFERIEDDEDFMMREYYSFTAGSTPLHIAVITKNIEITRLLVQRGADVHAKDSEELTPIHRLLELRYCPVVAAMSEILLAVRNLRDVVTSFGLSHLQVACWVNDETAVERLIDQGADINIRLTTNMFISLFRYLNYRPINFAYCCRRRSDVMELLFQRSVRLLGDPKDVLNAAHYTTSFNLLCEFKRAHAFTLRKWEKKHNIEPLQVACYTLDADAVEELLKQGKDPNARVLKGWIFWSELTSLHVLMTNVFAKESKVVKIAKLLLDHGADVMSLDPKGDTAVHRVFGHFKLKRKQTLLLLLNSQKDFEVNCEEDSERISHFHLACMCDAVSVVEKFLKHGININQTVHPMIASYGGHTPLQLAALFRAKETVDLLLKLGADVHSKNGEGNTALHCAVICNRKLGGDGEICESLIMSLIGAGAKIDTTNIYAETPLEVLLKTQKPSNELLRILSNQRCVNIFNYYKNGRGFIATAIKSLTNIKSIMEHPVYQAVINAPKINEVDKRGQTPIHNIVSIPKVAASVKVYTRAIEGFVNVGYYIDQQDIMGRTALHVAVYFHNSKAVAALLTLGANINLICDGETAFAYHWKRCKSLDKTKLLDREKQIVKLFAKQLYKLQLIHFNVSEMDKAIETELKERRWKLDLKIIEQCQVELERMETRKIGQSDILWWSLRSETGVIAAFPTMRQIDRQMICDVFEKQSFRFHQEFPEFAGILHWQYRKAVDRMSLIEPSKTALCWLINSNLPDLCSDRILRFLENADLADLIDAKENPVVHVNKRRRIC